MNGKRYRIIFIVYVVFFVLGYLLGSQNQNKVASTHKYLITKDGVFSDSSYWFSIYHDNRYWLVNKSGKVYDVYQDFQGSQFKTSPFVSGIDVDYETGEVDQKMLSFIPKDIPKIIFEINLNEKYITTTKSAVIYLTDIDDIIVCSSVLQTVGEYLDSGKIFLFKDGKLYLL